MKRILTVSALATLTLVLSACSQDTRAPENQLLVIDSSVPSSVQAEMREWYAALPDDLKAGVENPQLMFTASDGKVYSSKADVSIRQGKVIQGLKGRFIKFNDGSQGPAYPEDDFNGSVLEAQATTYTTCNSTDGPYYRSYSSSGYAGIYTEFTPYAPSFPAPIGSRSWAAYNYVGGQANNGSSEVDAGLVYYDSALRIFTNSNGVYNEWGRSYFGHGYSHPTRLYVTGYEQLAMTVATPNGATIFANISARFWNTAGTDQFLKRMATVANGDLAGRYNATYKYNLQSTSIIGNTQLGTYYRGSYVYYPWSSSRVYTSACRWPSSSIVYTNDSPTANTVTVYIDMSR